MTKKMVTIVNALSSKADEVATLRKMAECAKPQSYLAGLFTPLFLEWVEKQIADDVPCDIMDYLKVVRNRHRAAINDLRATRDKYRYTLEKAQQDTEDIECIHRLGLGDMQAKLNQQKGTADYWQGEAETMEARITAYRNVLALVWSLLEEMIAKRDAAERMVEQTKLKAFAILAKVL